MAADARRTSFISLKRLCRLLRVRIHLPATAQNAAVWICNEPAHVRERIAEENADLMRKFAGHAPL